MEIGSEWIRVGLISDKVPRKTFSASVLNAYKSKDPEITLKDYEISI